jgi:hypothetical protein
MVGSLGYDYFWGNTLALLSSLPVCFARFFLSVLLSRSLFVHVRMRVIFASLMLPQLHGGDYRRRGSGSEGLPVSLVSRSP